MIVCIGFGVACVLQASTADHLGFSVGNLLCLLVLLLAFAIFNAAFACYYLGHLLLCFLGPCVGVASGLLWLHFMWLCCLPL